MINRFRKIIYLLLPFLLLPFNVNADEWLDYVIDKYDINIIVNENNSFDITEKITAKFNTEKHGIIRNIPMRNNVTRLDGTTSRNRGKLTNLSVDDPYTLSKSNGNYVIKIGSPDYTITGEKEYTIKYNYSIGKDPLKGKDELYFNIIGTEWDTSINNVTFSIIMPKEFDSSKLGFSSGSMGSTRSDNIKYTVDDGIINGYLEDSLNAYQGLTIRLELPDDYFIVNTTFEFGDYLLFFIPIIFLGISILLWSKFGRDEKPVETVEFYPPNNMNSLETGFLYKGKADNQDVTSLLIYLANKGYIKISEIEQKILFKTHKTFKITKLKDYDGNNFNEKLFLKGLFTKRPTISLSSLFKGELNASAETENNTEVMASDLQDNFYMTMNAILGNINTKENKNKVIERSSTNKKVFLLLMIGISYILIAYKVLIDYGNIELLIPAIIFPSTGFSIMFSGLLSDTKKISPVLFGLVFGGIPFAFMVLPALMNDVFYLIGYIIGILSVFGMFVCLRYLPKRTPYGNEMLGKLKGFKTFLETAEKDKLEALVLENPNYFYNILPYTYVLNVSDKWIKKFETISMKSPDWYDSTTPFNVTTFNSFMNETMSQASSVMSSSPSSSGSGGGSSGGGSGGGGGSSW